MMHTYKHSHPHNSYVKGSARAAFDSEAASGAVADLCHSSAHSEAQRAA
jgi:hypothetical protein